MLELTVGSTESYDIDTEEFVNVGGTVLKLEHSLVSVSKWEQIFEKPFLSEGEKTIEETLMYIQCMLLDDDVPEMILNKLSRENFDAIDAYINAKMTATWFNEIDAGPPNRQTFTNELIYSWIFAAEINIEVERWHLSRLFTLLKTISIQRSAHEKQDKSKVAMSNRDIVARRRAELGTRG